MNSKISIGSCFIAAAAALVLFGCGSGGSTRETTARVGAAGATLSAGGAALSIPAGAVSDDVMVTLREAEPRHAGRSVRVEVEPSGLALAAPAMLSVKVDDANARVKIVDDAEHLLEVQVEDRA